MAPSDSDEIDEKVQKKLDKINAKLDANNARLDANTARLDESVEAQRKQTQAMEMVMGKLDQLIKSHNKPPDDDNRSVISGLGTRLGVPRGGGKNKGVGKGASRTAKSSDAAATAAANGDGDETIEVGSESEESASSRDPKKKKKTKKKRKTDSGSDSESEAEDFDPFNITGYVYDAASDEEMDELGNPVQRTSNRRRQPFVIGIADFEFGSEGADWTAWVKKFQSTILNACSPRTTEEHHKYNLRWLPSKLNTAAHDIWLNCRHKGSWARVVKELEEAFDDPEVKQKWSTDLKAYTWDEKSPLHVYKGNVMRYVNKFDSEIRGSEKALKKAYYSRFVGGMPDDYVNFIETSLYDGKRTIDRALKVAQQFQIIKKRTIGKASATKEVAAAGVAFHGNFGNERIQALEQDLAKLTTETNTLKNKVNSSGSDRRLTKDAGNTPAAERGRSNYRQNDRGHRSPSQSNHSSQSFGRNYGSQERRQNRDRLNEYKNKNGYIQVN